MALVVTMMPMDVFASETTEESVASCDDGVHDFTIEKYDESNHWYECSICGVADELLSHYYDENGDTICNGCSYERSIIEEISIDKTLMSEGETATITLKVIEGYKAKWIYFYKPITNNEEVVHLYLNSDNVYTGAFSVDDQTESGIWKVKYMTLKNAEDEYVYLFNSSNYTGTYFDKEDFSSLNFEVTGTNADVVAPVVESYSVDKDIASAGEKVTVSVQVTDEHLPSSFYFCYKNPSSESQYVSMKKVDDTGLYQGAFSIDADSETGIWRPYYFTVSDTNGNSTTLYNSKVTSYGSNKEDLSSLNFEVVEITEDEDEDAESFIVKFTDGYGNTLSTQRVNKGEDAVEPETPTNELYLFNGWDTDFTNITCNTTVNATWILNPNIVYDKEAHIGKTFSIEVYSTVSQTYTITCSDDIDFTSNLYSSGMIFTDQLYYSKKYEIEVNNPGSFLFYVKGSRSSNTLTYKVKITEHDFDSEYTIDKEATCTADGSKSRHCSRCDATTDVMVLERFEHNYSEEWTVDKEATCTGKGTKSHHCTRCESKTDVTVIPATGHIYETVLSKATTSNNGTSKQVCSVCGDVKSTTTIYKISSVTLSTSAYTYDGKTKSPSVTVKDSKGNKLTKGDDYTVTYGSSSRSAIGRYSVKVTFKGEYSGSKTLYFTIGPKNPSSVSAKLYGYDDVKVSWKKVSGATGYIVYYKKSTATSWSSKSTTGTSVKLVDLADGVKYDIKVVTYKTKSGYKCYNAGKTTSIYTLKKVADVKAVKSGTKVKVSWANISGETGYQISQSTKKSGTNIVATYKTTSGTSKTISATKGKTYYYKVRAYKVVDGKKIYGPWSTAVKFVRK